jgi:Protein of unknown function (DUF2934)
MATQPRIKIVATPPVSAGIASPSELHEQIRARAYQLYEERGKTEGHELEHWLQAEAELLPRPRAAA